jgi:hypothetical protein
MYSERKTIILNNSHWSAEMDKYSRLIRLISENPAIQNLLECSIGRIARRDKLGTDFILERSDDVIHFKDFLIASSLRNDKWLSNNDRLGRPNKMMKLGSIDACVAEADKAIRKELGSGGRIMRQGIDFEIQSSSKDGYSLVRLMSPKALDFESSAMGHCIGNGAYDDFLQTRKYFSLRNSEGHGCATLETDHDKILQIRGPKNKTPHVDVLKKIKWFANRGCIPNDPYIKTQIQLAKLVKALDELKTVMRTRSYIEPFE